MNEVVFPSKRLNDANVSPLGLGEKSVFESVMDHCLVECFWENNVTV